MAAPSESDLDVRDVRRQSIPRIVRCGRDDRLRRHQSRFDGRENTFAARRQREQAGAKKREPHPLDLRFVAEEGQTYDGRELRTGEELTPEKWEELRRRDEGLPAWKPKPPPGQSFEDSASLIDLTEVRPAAADPAPPAGADIELPPWARQDDVTIPPPATPTPDPAAGTCVNCGGEPRVAAIYLP